MRTLSLIIKAKIPKIPEIYDNLMVGICAMCKEKGVDLTIHHVHEAPKKGDRIQTILICKKCHDNHNLYLMALRDNNITRQKRIRV